MPRSRFSLFAMALMVVAVLSACASGGMGQGDAGPAAASVVVNNNLTVPTSLTIHLVPESGVRRLLGSVSPGGTEQLPVRGALVAGRYRLLARTTGGTDLVSDPFTITEGETVTWDLRSNMIRVGGS